MSKFGVRKLLAGASEEASVQGLCRTSSAIDCIEKTRADRGISTTLIPKPAVQKTVSFFCLCSSGVQASASETRDEAFQTDDRAWSLHELSILHQLQKPIAVVMYDR